VRVLHLTPELPFAPGGSGGSTRQFQLLRSVSELGHEVAVVAPAHASQRDHVGRLRDAGIEARIVHRPRSRAREVLTALPRRPALVPAPLRDPVLAWQVEVFWASLRAHARELLATWSPDVVSVEHDWAAAWHRDLPAGVPRLLTLQNLSWRYYAARSAAAGGARAALLALEARRFLRHDRRHLGAYDLLVAMSDEDRAAVRAATAVRCESVPNGVDTSALRPAPPPDDAEPLLLFTGTLSYPPNADAARWLLRDIWPRVLARAPHARLRIVGPDPPGDLVGLAGERAVLTGRVPDVAPHFAEATAVLVPIRSGGGTRLKVLDGLAAGRPMVATAAGAEGIAVRDGEHLLLADGAEPFARAALRLLDDAALRARLAAAGRTLVEREYDWRALGDRFERLLRELTARDRG
jgi:glycosyltransferase involved in cell wall biosynthesis